MATAFQCDRCLKKFEGEAHNHVVLTQALDSQTQSYELCDKCFANVSTNLETDIVATQEVALDTAAAEARALADAGLEP
jgi:hypothetical protein